jgi:hypothetical protein
MQFADRRSQPKLLTLAIIYAYQHLVPGAVIMASGPINISGPVCKVVGRQKSMPRMTMVGGLFQHVSTGKTHDAKYMDLSSLDSIQRLKEETGSLPLVVPR